MLISRIGSRSWHSFNAVIAFIQKTCRRTSSLCASALPSLSPFTMSEVTGLSRWGSQSFKAEPYQEYFKLRWANTLLRLSFSVDVSLTWGKCPRMNWLSFLCSKSGPKYNRNHFQVWSGNCRQTLSHGPVLGHPRASRRSLHPDRGRVLCWDQGPSFQLGDTWGWSSLLPNNICKMHTFGFGGASTPKIFVKFIILICRCYDT